MFSPFGILGGDEKQKEALKMVWKTKPIIIAIDDDPIILNSLTSVLKDEFGVRPFTSGRMALDFLAGQTADLILLDYRMPDMTGFEVLKVLQGDPHTRDIPVIFLTGSNDSESEADALEHGAVDYITKPIRPRLLHTRVRLQLELQRHRKNLEALVEERTKSLAEAYDKLKVREDVTLCMLAKATDLRDHYTGGHIERTTEFVRVIVEDILDYPCPGYNISRTDADDMIRSSKLHDLGKIALPDHVLLKPGRLTQDEFEIIKKHPISGERFLSEFIHEMDDSFLTMARDIAYSHHEKWDGTGYPQGLKGEDIPLSGRISAIADVYDALTSVRPYKKHLSHEESVKIILEGSGTQFDPYLVEIFERHAEEFRQIAEQIGMREWYEAERIEEMEVSYQ